MCYKFIQLVCVLAVLSFSACSKKDDVNVGGKSLTDTTKSSTDKAPTFSFTLTATANVSSATINLVTTGNKPSDILKYNLTVNSHLLTENQQSASYEIINLTPETDYEVKVELKDQFGNSKTQTVKFRTLKYYLKFTTTYDVSTKNEGDSFLQTPDGGYIVSGFAPGKNGNDFSFEVITLLRVDKFGKEIWSNKFEYDNRFSIGHTKFNVIQLGDGGFVVNGSSAVIKVDANGNKVWEHYFPRTGLNLLIRNISVNKDNTIMVCGYGDDGALIYKFSSNGELIWKNHFYDSDKISFTTATAISETGDKSYIVIGEYADEFVRSYYAKLDDKGNLLWLNRLPKTGTSHAISVKPSTDGSFTVLTNTLGNKDVPKITRINTNGEVLMATDLQTSNYFSVTGFDFTPDGYILSGIYVPPYVTIFNYWVLIKTDNTGKILWENQYASGNCWDVKYIDEGFVASGSSGSFPDQKIQLMKVDQNGKN